MRIFISHTHSDRDIVAALAQLLHALFGARVEMHASSDVPHVNSIPIGANWMEWIDQQIQSEDVTIVLLSAQAVEKPWVIWESAAVMGIARGKGNPLLPLAFRINVQEQLPAAISALQVAYGDREADIRKFCQTINHRAAAAYPDTALATLLGALIPPYLAAVNQALDTRPLPLNEALIQEWLSRIAAIEDRPDEVEHIHQTLRLAHSLPGDTTLPPLDLRIHRRLGELYLRAGRGEEAAREFTLALAQSPRDVYLLHQLGLAHLTAGSVQGAEAQLEKVQRIDPKLEQKNPEVAAFAARVARAKWDKDKNPRDLERARTLSQTAAALSPKSYYLRDLVAQYSLMLGELDAAKTAYDEVQRIIDGTGESSIWALSSYANAAFAQGNVNVAKEKLRALMAKKPARRDVDSIRSGLLRIGAAIGAAPATHAELDAALLLGA